MALVSEIHNVLVDWGFRADLGWDQKPRYIAELEIEGYVFPLEIRDIDENFIDLPKVTLAKIPDGLPERLPHVNPDNSLCYLDREGVYLDRYRPGQTVDALLRRVWSLLKSYTDPASLPKEFADEFVAYWDPQYRCYLLTKEKGAVARAFARTKIGENEHDEIVIAGGAEELDEWERKRNSVSKDAGSVSAVIVQLGCHPLIPLNCDWPPKTLQALYDWLARLDVGAAQSLIDQLAQVACQNARVPIVILTQDAHCGVLVHYGPRFRLECRRGGRKLRQVLLSQRQIKDFARLLVEDATMEHISSRPLGASRLAGLRIAQIGCGAVGGYSAVMLSQAGAGQGSGKLDLFDSGIYQSDNMGRNVLGVQHLGEQKSVALKSYLDDHCSTNSINIHAFGDWDCQSGPYADYDLIIDATGDQIFSTALSHHLHRLKRKPDLIHGWIDAGGLAARALLDDGRKACYRCLVEERGEQLTERFALVAEKDREKIPKINRRCGVSYQPYSSNAPAAAAGLIQQLAMGYGADERSPRFRHLSLSDLVTDRKGTDPKRRTRCPCCQVH